MYSLLSALLFLPAASSQDAPVTDLPTRPTVASLSMRGTGCPIGGGGIATDVINGTPVFSFPLWTLDLASKGEEGRVEKFCVQDMQLANGPAGYQVRVSGVTVSGLAELSGAVLGVRAEMSLGGEDAGGGETTLLTDDILSNGTFTASVEATPEAWSACVGEDGVVPLIRLQTTLSLEGQGDAVGAVGREGAELEEAVSVHFAASWRECEY